MEEVIKHKGRYITGYYGCSCHPFASWEECNRAHKQKLKVGLVVQHRCLRTVGVVHEETDRLGFCLVKYGPQPCDIHQEHVAQLAPHGIQSTLFKSA